MGNAAVTFILLFGSVTFEGFQVGKKIYTIGTFSHDNFLRGDVARLREALEAQVKKGAKR